MNVLTFDIEEWFHILDNSSTMNVKSWNNYESRINNNMDKIFKILIDNNISATFFVVGWIAEKYPDIVKKIDSLNFEIGSHTHLHQLMYNQSYEQVNEDLKKSLSTIESITGKKITKFRAPGFSITNSNKWAFEILIKHGIKIDASIFPAKRAHGGFSSFFESKPSIIELNGLKIKELPINTVNTIFGDFVFSGGGYFRLIPYFMLRYFTKKSDYTMTYFHPRDFDPDQPIIKELSYYRRFKSYYGLSTSSFKLSKWVKEFDFIDMKKADNLINWESAPVVNLNLN